MSYKYDNYKLAYVQIKWNPHTHLTRQSRYRMYFLFKTELNVLPDMHNVLSQPKQFYSVTGRFLMPSKMTYDDLSWPLQILVTFRNNFCNGSTHMQNSVTPSAMVIMKTMFGRVDLQSNVKSEPRWWSHELRCSKVLSFGDMKASVCEQTYSHTHVTGVDFKTPWMGVQRLTPKPPGVTLLTSLVAIILTIILPPSSLLSHPWRGTIELWIPGVRTRTVG
jgi:hypothetical protein